MSSVAWKDIPEFPYYLVSNEGLVRSTKFGGDRLLKFSTKQKYPLVYLFKEGKATTISIHRLVMLSFIGPCPSGMEVRHLDGNSSNNNLKNLVYGTPEENSADKTRHGTNWQANKTECKQGHPYNEANTYVARRKTGGVHRDCRACALKRYREKRHILVIEGMR